MGNPSKSLMKFEGRGFGGFLWAEDVDVLWV